MAEMHAIAARSASGVQKERFALFISIQNLVKFPTGGFYIEPRSRISEIIPM